MPGPSNAAAHAAIDIYAHALGPEFDPCAIDYAAGRLLLLSGHVDAALDRWLEALSRPGARGWPVLMNAIYETALRVNRAVEVRDVLDRHAASLAELHLWSGLLSRHLAQADRALASLEAAQNTTTGDLQFTAATERIRTLVAHERTAEALQVCDEVLGDGLDNPVLLRTTRASLLNRLDRAGEALTELEAILQHHPTLAPAWLNRGSALLRLGHPDAHASLREAVRLDPSLASAAATLAKTLP